MSVPKLHHYVPQFYLKRFTGKQGLFWVWDKKTQKIFHANPNGIAAETHFYRVPELIGTEHDPLFLERELSHLEETAARITNVWIDSFSSLQPVDKLSIDEEDRWQMASFMSVQFLRTAEQRDILALFATESGHYQADVSADEKINMHVQMLCSGGLVEGIAERIFRSIWLFARNGTSTPFCTSDNPVSFKTKDNRMWLKGPGILSDGSYVVFPVTPSYVLYCKEPTYWSKLEQLDCCLSPVEMTSEMVVHENSGQVFNATRSVISPDNNFEFAKEFAKTIGTDTYAPENS
jgi:hypothetical protein